MLACFWDSLVARVAYARRLGTRVVRGALRRRGSYLLSYIHSFIHSFTQDLHGQTGTDQAHERKDPATGRTYDTVYSIYGSIRVRLQHSEHTRAMVSHGLIGPSGGAGAAP
jgi:hypothetical protein